MVNKNSIFKLILLFFIISIVFSVNVSAKPIQFAGSPEQNMTLISTNCDEGYDSCANGNYEVNYKSFADTDQTVKYSRDNSTLFFTPMNLAYRGVQSWEEYEELNNAQSLPPSSGVLKNIMYYVDLFYDGIDLRYSNNQYQLKEELIINSFDSLPEPSSWLCKEEECTIYLELHELITYDSGTQLWINNELYDGSSTITTDNPIEFKDEDGQLLYYIDTPTAYDSNGSEISFNYTLKYQNKKTYLYWQIPYQWLNDTSRVYPVNIDPNIFSSNAVESVDASAFDTTSFVIAYVDDTNDDVSTIVYNTNGSVITAEIDIDDAMGGGTNPNVVAVATVTPEKYCVVFIDDTDEDVIFYTVHKNGSILYGPITVDSEVGGSKAVGITRMTDNSIAISYGDDVSDQETIAVYYINGTAILSPQQHVSVSSHVVSSVSRLTDTTFVNTFSINGANLQAKVFDTSGNEILGATTYDTIENTVYHNADVIRLTDSSFLLGYIDTTDDDATVSVMTTSGTETLDSFDIDTDISPGFSAQSCGIATINNHSGILAYFDDNENDISYGIFDTNGTLLFGPTDVDTGAVDQGVAVIASDNDNPDALSLCSDTAIIIWASAQSWTAIHTNNNSGWDGSCNAVPTLTSTAFTSSDLVSDANAYLNTTYTDGDSENGTAYLKCYVNDENTFNSTTSNIISGSEISFVIGKGNFTDCNTLNCSIYANDGTENSETVWSPKKTIYGYVDITNFAVNDTSIGLNGEVNLNTTVSLSG
ncbi:MAG: hypothetical protein U9O94_07315, partial [Nanoarchaeota archaeon]|nr:hypothetical protein [Nanoarchaeota archaeon]